MIITNKYSIKFGLSCGYSIVVPHTSMLDSAVDVARYLKENYPEFFLTTDDDNNSVLISMDKVEYIHAVKEDKEESDVSSESTL